MSQQLISRSPDLGRLRADGYDVEVQSGFLMVRDVPYLDGGKNIAFGMLVKSLTLSGDVADYQGDHTIFLAGPTPHDADGQPLQRVINATVQQEPLPGLVVDHVLSNKPTAGYVDYYELITTYVAVLSKHARTIDETVTAQTFPQVRPDTEEGSPFLYVDTASTRAGITAINAKVEGHRVAIIGLGGTGAYILDMVAKSPVAELHLYDGDRLMQHNAFRYPGAIPLETVTAKPMKVDYFAQQYATFRHGVTAHPVPVDEHNVDELASMDFVFLAIDDNASRAVIAKGLEAADVAFIDVGMGLYLAEGGIGGQVRITSSLPGHREHLWDDRKRLPTSVAADDLYGQNVQIVDMNALNAALAVNRWKRHVGIYADLEGEHFSLYASDGNDITNEDQ
jgi:ThiF family